MLFQFDYCCLWYRLLEMYTTEITALFLPEIFNVYTSITYRLHNYPGQEIDYSERILLYEGFNIFMHFSGRWINAHLLEPPLGRRWNMYQTHKSMFDIYNIRQKRNSLLQISLPNILCIKLNLMSRNANLSLIINNANTFQHITKTRIISKRDQIAISLIVID